MDTRLMVEDGQLLAIFNSTHRVMKAEQLLKEMGLPILLIPAPRQLNTDCALAIRFTKDQETVIMQALENKGVSPAFVSRYSQGKFITVWGTDATDTTTAGEYQ